MSTDSIGSDVSRDHANPADWWAAIPSSLTEAELGECYNDSEVNVSTAWNFSGKTEGAHQITLTTAAGESFADNSSNPLRYDSSAGVAFYGNSAYTNIIGNLSDGMILSKIQFEHRSSGNIIHNTQAAATIIERNLFSVDNARVSIRIVNAATAVRNNCIIHKATSSHSDGVTRYQYGTPGYFNTIAVPADVTSSAVLMNGNSSSSIIKNCACFGSSVASSGTFSSSSEFNATDDSAIVGTDALTSLTYADQFNNSASASTMDLRVKAGSDLIGAGVAVSGITTDIFGTTRADPPTIGCYEYEAPEKLPAPHIINRAVQRASYI